MEDMSGISSGFGDCCDRVRNIHGEVKGNDRTEQEKRAKQRTESKNM